MPALTKVTPLITVDAVEPCLPFWTDTLGFEVVASVPHADATGFALLSNGPVELMYQSRASVDDDLGGSGGPPALAGEMASATTTLFVEVEDLDGVIAALGDVEVLVPRRRTFYGMDEIFVRAPCGSVVGFAARIAG